MISRTHRPCAVRARAFHEKALFVKPPWWRSAPGAEFLPPCGRRAPLACLPFALVIGCFVSRVHSGVRARHGAAI